jgi:hypothetical protein
MLWNELDMDRIEFFPSEKEKTRFGYAGGPLRFQIPRGLCTWGVSDYKSFTIDMSDPSFFAWWAELEERLGGGRTPFVSNLRSKSLRIKVDDSVYIFDADSKQTCPDLTPGLFRGEELSCIVTIDSNYFYQGNWGLVVRADQIKSYARPEPEPPVCTPGVCAFD